MRPAMGARTVAKSRSIRARASCALALATSASAWRRAATAMSCWAALAACRQQVSVRSDWRCAWTLVASARASAAALASTSARFRRRGRSGRGRRPWPRGCLPRRRAPGRAGDLGPDLGDPRRGQAARQVEGARHRDRRDRDRRDVGRGARRTGPARGWPSAAGLQPCRARMARQAAATRTGVRWREVGIDMGMVRWCRAVRRPCARGAHRHRRGPGGFVRSALDHRPAVQHDDLVGSAQVDRRGRW